MEWNQKLVENKESISFDSILKLAFCLEGRDKLTKIVQYGSRALAWYYLSNKGSEEWGQRFQSLYKTVQQSRKAFRIGKSLKEYQKWKSIDFSKSSSLMSFELLLHCLRHGGMFGYFFYDNLIFFIRAKFCLTFQATEASIKGTRLWFIATVSTLLLAWIELKKQRQLEKIQEKNNNKQKKNSSNVIVAVVVGSNCVGFQKRLALLQAIFDVIVSSNSPGVCLFEKCIGKKLNDGIIGIFGCLSASIALFNTWPTHTTSSSKLQTTKTK